jgi:hypothetical protein
MLFIDYSLAFNNIVSNQIKCIYIALRTSADIVPSKLITKLGAMGLNTSLCNWILDFLTGQIQVLRVGKITVPTLTLNMGKRGRQARPQPNH